MYQTYDLRGKYPEEINENLAYKLGQALPPYLKAKRIAVGRDMRLSSPALFHALVQGIISQGADVLNLGLVGTELVYFCSGFYNWPAVMITASHAFGNYNGFKICQADGAGYLSAETGLLDLMKLLNKKWPSVKKQGKILKKNIWPDFKKYILSFVKLDKFQPLKIMVDAGNGMAGKMIPFVFQGLPFKIEPLYFELDGSFPHHLANTSVPDNLKDLQKHVKAKKADLGLAYDGDADRVSFIDEKGQDVDDSFIVALLAKFFLETNPGASIVYTVRSSRIVAETIKQAGGIPIQSKVGHSYIKEAAKKHQAIFGGETSGHYAHRSFYYTDSAMLVTLLVLEILCLAKKPLSEIIKPFRKYHYEVISFDVKEKDKKILPKKFAKFFKNGKIDWLDGLTVNYPQWWFNLRGSGTSPIMRFTIEAKTKKLLKRKKKYLLVLLKKFKDVKEFGAEGS